jgi:acetate kinase
VKILVINSGSSSIKYQLFKIENGYYELLAKGLVDRIGLSGSTVYHRPTGKEETVVEKDIPGHEVGIKLMLNLLAHTSHGVIKDIKEIQGVGHRVVHGGERFYQSVLIDDEVEKTIEECIELAPLHNPPNLLGIRSCKRLLPGVPQVAVFDTAFHQSMPKKAYLYGLPIEQYEKYRIRRYGFHGTSHRYVALEAAKTLGKDITELKIVTCHLGNGCSITAVNNGKSVDTSMGFTPLEGLVMGTRAGDMDPYIPLFIIEKQGLSPQEVNNLMNKKSGLLGLSGNRDMRDVSEAAENGDERAKIAREIFIYRVAKYIGAYAMAMKGLDAVVFTAGMGENSTYLREKILEYGSFLGIKVDREKNKKGERIFTTPDSTVVGLVIPTNEELVIAQDTYDIINR